MGIKDQIEIAEKTVKFYAKRGPLYRQMAEISRQHVEELRKRAVETECPGCHFVNRNHTIECKSLRK